MLIYQTLKKCLDEISKSLESVKAETEVSHSINLEPLFFQCISVIFIDDTVEDNNILSSSSNIFYQTFRISIETTVENVIDSCLLLWERVEDQEKFELYIIKGEKRENVKKSYKINDLFKVPKLQIKSAQFILCTKEAKFNYEDIITKKNNKNQNIEVNAFRDDHDNHYIKFITHLCGVTRDVDESYQRLKDNDDIKNQKKDNEFTWNRKTFIAFLQKGILYVIFLLFFIFSFLGINQHKDPYKNYIDVTILKTILFGDDNLVSGQKGLTSEEYLNLLENIAGLYTYDTENSNFKLINMMRLTLYRSQIKTCDSDYINYFNSVYKDKELICYKYKYEDKVESGSHVYPYFENGEYEKDSTICNPEDIQNNYFIYSTQQTETETKSKNYIGSCEEDFLFYLSNIFRVFKTENFEIDPIFLESSRGVFKGQINKNDINSYNSIDIFLTVNFVNKAVVRKVIDIFSKEGLFDLVSQKASTLSYAFYSTITKRYYYVGILFEHTGTRVEIGDFKIIPFYPNLKTKENGKLIYVLDIFRLLFAIAIVILAVKTIYDKIQEIKQKNQERRGVLSHITNVDEISLCKEIISSLFTLDLVLDILIFIFYVIIFSIKSKLYLDLSKVEILSTVGNELDSFYQLNAYEYYTQAHANENLSIYEGILSLLILLKLIALIAYYRRSDNFLVYIKHSITKIFPYFAFLLILLLFFAIYSNILWGDVDKVFSSYSSAFLATLLLSISHFPSPSDCKAKEIYSVVFYFLFFIIIIFFMISSLPSMLIESYRLTSLRLGNSYSIRQAKLFRIKEKELQNNANQDEKDITKNTLKASNSISKSNINYK